MFKKNIIILLTLFLLAGCLLSCDLEDSKSQFPQIQKNYGSALKEFNIKKRKVDETQVSINYSDEPMYID